MKLTSSVLFLLSVALIVCDSPIHASTFRANQQKYKNIKLHKKIRKQKIETVIKAVAFAITVWSVVHLLKDDTIETDIPVSSNQSKAFSDPLKPESVTHRGNIHAISTQRFNNTSRVSRSDPYRLFTGIPHRAKSRNHALHHLKCPKVNYHRPVCGRT